MPMKKSKCTANMIRRSFGVKLGFRLPLRKMGITFTLCNSVMDILYNTVVIIPIAKLIVRSLVGKLL